MKFDGIALLLTMFVLCFFVTLFQFYRYRRALREIASSCKRCDGHPGGVLYSHRMVECPDCATARRALNLPRYPTATQWTKTRVKI